MKDQRKSYAAVTELCTKAVRAHSVFRMRVFDTRKYEVDGSVYKLYCIERKRQLAQRPHVFIIAGFHGEEPAGPMAIAREVGKWLTFAQKHRINIQIVPCANPWGYDRNIRNTPISTYTNGGYTHGLNTLAAEFAPLKDLLKTSRIEYYLDLHEDDTDPKGCYTYAFGDQAVARRVLQAMSSAEIPLDPRPETDDPEVISHLIGDGLVYDLHDGSSEDFVSHKRECRVALAPEVPSTLFPLSVRVKAHLRGACEFLHAALTDFEARKSKNKV